MSNILITFIRLYQRTFSPDHGWFRFANPHGYCRYYPSCSSYAIEAIEKYGGAVGMLKSFVRVLRCNPWGKGGVDRP